MAKQINMPGLREDKKLIDLTGKGDLRLISEVLGYNLKTLRFFAQQSDFPGFDRLAGVRIYDISEVAKYLDVEIS